jgi:hypothetical protein
LEWTLKAGETLEFPAYVANYLMGIYDFLKETGVQAEQAGKPIVQTVSEAKPTVGSANCIRCGAHFKNLRALGLHTAGKHPEVLL